MIESTSTAATATQRTPHSLKGMKYPAYRARITAIAAMIPECMLQNMPQPHKNPIAGEKISFRNTYTPPVDGKTAESSAQTRAPQSVRTPAASHTTRTPVVLGTSRVISEGWMKMEAPSRSEERRVGK